MQAGKGRFAVLGCAEIGVFCPRCKPTSLEAMKAMMLSIFPADDAPYPMRESIGLGRGFQPLAGRELLREAVV